MLVTSVTSSVAFLSCARSQITPIRSFGFFAAVIIIMCYIITILVQPMNYFIYEKFVKNIVYKDGRLDKIPQRNYEFGYGSSTRDSNASLNSD
jgi:predicted RND superfamily exporter protein